MRAGPLAEAPTALKQFRQPCGCPSNSVFLVSKLTTGCPVRLVLPSLFADIAELGIPAGCCLPSSSLGGGLQAEAPARAAAARP